MNPLDRTFLTVDVLLRRGAHINRTDAEIGLYEFCSRNHDELSAFYSALDCRLERHPDGFFYIVPYGDRLRTRVMPMSLMHVGQVLALQARDPAITRTRGVLSVEKIHEIIHAVTPRDILRKIYCPRVREGKFTERVTEEIDRALRRLDDLGCLRLIDAGKSVELLNAIHRFADAAKLDSHEVTDPIDADILRSKKGIVRATRTTLREKDTDGDERG